MKRCEDCGLKGFKSFRNSKIFKKLLCTICYYKRYSKLNTEKRKKEHLCLNCNKKVQPTRCPHCKKIIKYMSKCKKCRIK